MKSPALQSSLLVLFLTTSVLVAGCNRHVESDQPPAKPTAEQRFERILESFRRSVEDQPVSYVVADGDSRSTMFGTYTVSAKLIPPGPAGEPYKATIKVTSESHYSLRRSKSAEDAEKEQKAKNKSTSALDDPAQKNALDILEPDLAGANRAPKSPTLSSPKQADEETVTRRPTIEVREYELTYDGDRWQLVTKPDPKTEQSIQFAFDQALDRQ
jgi:hypothetical protein